MAATYSPIATYTVSGSSIASYTFIGISTSYTDLILVCNYKPTAGSVLFMQVGNGTIDTGSNYSQTGMGGYGSGGGKHSYNYSSQGQANIGAEAISTSTSIFSNVIVNFNNYANTNIHKSFISRYVDGDTLETNSKINLWRSNSAINQIKIYASSGNLSVGSTFTLYGIAAA